MLLPAHYSPGRSILAALTCSRLPQLHPRGTRWELQQQEHKKCNIKTQPRQQFIPSVALGTASPVPAAACEKLRHSLASHKAVDLGDAGSHPHPGHPMEP